MLDKIKKILQDGTFFQDTKVKSSKRKLRFSIIALIILGILVAAYYYLGHRNIEILNPKGEIALKETHLIYFALLLSLLVVVPVFIMGFTIAWKYRDGNKKSKYSPEFDHNLLAEITWWGIPSVIIFILSIVAWNSSHQLDPFKPIASENKTINIEVVALTWKWLFIYPQQDIATVNYLRIPENTPINFEVTSDAPMNSFWIPQLGGQIYAMPGMSTELHLIASGIGSYRGLSANISGNGFAGMNFVAQSTSATDFYSWTDDISRAPTVLDAGKYQQLAKPSENNRPSYYSSVDFGLYDQIVAKYNDPTTQTTGVY